VVAGHCEDPRVELHTDGGLVGRWQLALSRQGHQRRFPHACTMITMFVQHRGYFEGGEAVAVVHSSPTKTTFRRCGGVGIGDPAAASPNTQHRGMWVVVCRVVLCRVYLVGCGRTGGGWAAAIPCTSSSTRAVASCSHRHHRRQQPNPNCRAVWMTAPGDGRSPPGRSGAIEHRRCSPLPCSALTTKQLASMKSK
jgi:hypothetical protein